MRDMYLSDWEFDQAGFDFVTTQIEQGYTDRQLEAARPGATRIEV